MNQTDADEQSNYRLSVGRWQVGAAYILFFAAIPTYIVGNNAYVISAILLSLFVTFYYRKYFFNYSMAALLAIFIVYFWLSNIDGIRGASDIYQKEFILKQSIQYILIFFSLPAFTVSLLSILINNKEKLFLGIIIPVLFVSNLTIAAQQNVMLGGKIYGTLTGSFLLELSIILYALKYIERLPYKLIILAVMFVFSGSATNQIVSAFSFAVLMLPYTSAVTIAGVAGVFAVILVVLGLDGDGMAALKEVDHNALVRAYLWKSVAAKIYASDFMGVGFGVEYRPWRFVWLAKFHASLASMDGFVTANHNSFLDNFYRLGIGGFLALLGIIFQGWPRRVFSSLDMKVGCFVLFSVVVACAFNPMLESVRSLMGLSFGIGYLYALQQFYLLKPVQPEALSAVADELPPRKRRVPLSGYSARRRPLR